MVRAAPSDTKDEPARLPTNLAAAPEGPETNVTDSSTPMHAGTEAAPAADSGVVPALATEPAEPTESKTSDDPAEPDARVRRTPITKWSPLEQSSASTEAIALSASAELPTEVAAGQQPPTASARREPLRRVPSSNGSAAKPTPAEPDAEAAGPATDSAKQPSTTPAEREAATPAAEDPANQSTTPSRPEPPEPEGASAATPVPLETAPAEPQRKAANPAPRAKPRQSIALSVEAVTPETVTLGKPIAYELIVRNTGGDPAEDVVVEESVPDGAELQSADPEPAELGPPMTWQLGTLEAGAERRIGLRILPQREGEFERMAAVHCLVRAGRSTRVTRPKLTLVKVGPQQVIVGETAGFLLKVSNPGSGAATNVILHDTLPSGLEHAAGSEIEYELGTLAPGETRDVNLELIAREPGRHINRAEVVADDGLRATAEAAITVLEPMLTLEHAGPAKRYLARLAKYTLTVGNPGTAPAADVVVTNELPAGFEFVEASDNGRHHADKNQVTWAMAQIPVGGSRAVTMTLRATRAGEQLNHAVAAARGGLKAEAESRTLVDGIPALLLEVVDIDDPVEVGAETTFEIRVLNQGSKPGTNIRVHVSLPQGLTPVSAEGPAPHQIRGQEVVFEPLRVLGPRADAAYYVRARGAKPGNPHMSVRLESDQLDQPVHEEESTHVYADQ